MTSKVVRRALVVLTLLLAAGAAVLRTPYRPATASMDVQTLASEVARESDHITALELAEWIKSSKPGLQVIDVRSVKEFDSYHIPTARAIPLETLVRTTFDPDSTLVLYSQGGGHAAQAWVMLRALGYRKVFCLRGGLDDWLEDVMHPAAQTDVTRYFGGVQRKPGDPPLTVDALRRRGC